MYEVVVTYQNEKNADTLLCDSKPSAEFTGKFVILNCGKGQQFSFNVDTFFKAAIKYPLPDKIPSLKYAVDIHYNEDVELLFSPNTVDVDVKGEIVLVKEGDNVIRIINGSLLRSVKVSAYTEENVGSSPQA